MSAIREVIDIDCSPDDVFAYVTDSSHLPEWQLSAVAAERLDEGPLREGSRVRVTRRRTVGVCTVSTALSGRTSTARSKRSTRGDAHA
jgi:hypothetical protein